MKIYTDISYSEDGLKDKKLDIYLPDKDSFDVFFYIHGGGLEKGDKWGAQFAAKYVAEHGVALVAINYRIYPEAVYPQFILDVAEAISWVKNNIEKYGKCKRFFVGGSSAGAYISMMLCFDKKYLMQFNIPGDYIKGYIHDAGQPTTHFNVLRERGMDTQRIVVDEAAPLFHIGRDLDYPDMLFIVSDNDVPGRYQQVQLVLSTLKCYGFDEEKTNYLLMHGTHCKYSETEEFGKIICDFIDKVNQRLN